MVEIILSQNQCLSINKTVPVIIFEELRYSLDERVIKIKDRSLVDEGQTNLLKIWYNGLWRSKRRRS